MNIIMKNGFFWQSTEENVCIQAGYQQIGDVMLWSDIWDFVCGVSVKKT